MINLVSFKICIKCNKNLPIEIFLVRTKRGKQSRPNICKFCLSESNNNRHKFLAKFHTTVKNLLSKEMYQQIKNKINE